MFSSEWVLHYMKLAYFWASRSKYPGTHVGCVVASSKKQQLSQGYNGIPRGVEDRLDRMTEDNKYLWVEHAERNAIYNATLNGVSLEGAAMFATHFPCADCARGIIQSGISHVYYGEELKTPQWAENCRVSKEMLEEAGVKLILVE